MNKAVLQPTNYQEISYLHLAVVAFLILSFAAMRFDAVQFGHPSSDTFVYSCYLVDTYGTIAHKKLQLPTLLFQSVREFSLLMTTYQSICSYKQVPLEPEVMHNLLHVVCSLRI